MAIMAGTVAVGLTGRAVAEELPATAPVNTGENCAVLVDPVEDGAKMSKTRDLGCFDTFAEAVAAGTGAPVKEGLTPETFTEADAAPELTTLAIDWNNPRYRGGSVIYYTSNPFGCFGYFYTFNVVPRPNWSSSTKAFSGCRKNDNYPGIFLTGLGWRCKPNCATFPAFWNNNTESKQLRR
ncbi:MAG: hypothetical protein U1E66_05710 [Rhodospirillales bacterium]